MQKFINARLSGPTHESGKLGPLKKESGEQSGPTTAPKPYILLPFQGREMIFLT